MIVLKRPLPLFIETTVKKLSGKRRAPQLLLLSAEANVEILLYIASDMLPEK